MSDNIRQQPPTPPRNHVQLSGDDADDLFADCREGNHRECMYQYPQADCAPDANGILPLLTCGCACHRTAPTQPAPETDGEWSWNYSDMKFHVRESGNGDCVAHTTTERAAAQIVREHNSLPLLVTALREALSIVHEEGHTDNYQPQVRQAYDALAAVGREEERDA